MENDYAGYGVLGLILILFIIVWAILWLFVPFMIYYMQQDIKRMRGASERMLGELERIRREASAGTIDLPPYKAPPPKR